MDFNINWWVEYHDCICIYCTYLWCVCIDYVQSAPGVKVAWFYTSHQPLIKHSSCIHHTCRFYDNWRLGAPLSGMWIIFIVW